MTIYQTLKKVKPSIKKDWLENNTDLIENGILDSFEMLEFILLLEKKYNFNYEKYVKKHNNFKINDLEAYLNLKIF
tara:strand:- start:1196 stop:1423 length:228 start_codon:yes stop_codon:yes gene_type:complete